MIISRPVSEMRFQTALLAQVEASFIGGLNADSGTASDSALRFFVYAATILNLSATFSAVILLLAVTSVPTSARRIYMTCPHGFPRKVFHSKDTPSTTPADNQSSYFIPPMVSQTEDEENSEQKTGIHDLNRHLLRGNTEGFLLDAFGVAQGWGFLVKHCIFCFIGGCICAFTHICISVWLNSGTAVSSVLMAVSFIGFVPPLVIYFFRMGPPQCERCKMER